MEGFNEYVEIVGLLERVPRDLRGTMVKALKSRFTDEEIISPSGRATVSNSRPESDSLNDLVRVTDAAKELEVSSSYLYTASRRGKIKVVTDPESGFRSIRRADLLSLAASRRK